MRGFVIAAVLLSFALPVGAAPGEHVSTLADQRSVSLTVYNNDLALVRDARRIRVPSGRGVLAFRDVSGGMQPETALLRAAGGDAALRVIEQNFSYDLLSRATLIQKYVGRDVTVIRDDPRTGHETRERAKILSNNGDVMLQYADRVEAYTDGRIAFPTIPSNLRDRPTLLIDVENQAAAEQDVELTYLTNGLGWTADYVAALSSDEKMLDLSGKVTMRNTSGTTYANAHLALVAGEPRIIRRSAPPIGQVLTTIGRSVASPEFVESAVSEYHLYRLGRTTTIANNQTKALALLTAGHIPVQKTLELRGNPSYYRGAFADLGTRIPVGSYLTFTNAGGELGIPLPAGIVNVYQRDASGAEQFVGSDRIDHTPRNETVRLGIGSSFDVTAHRVQRDFGVFPPADPYRFHATFEITLRNAKDIPQTVIVVEPIPGDWKIVTESAPHEKSSSGTATWTLTVPAQGSTQLTYEAYVR